MCYTFGRGKSKIKTKIPHTLNIRNIFDTILKKYKLSDVYFFGFGNPYRSDDGFGIRIIEILKELEIKNCYTESDYYEDKLMDLSKNQKNKVVFFFDISEFSDKAGDIRIFTDNELEDPPRNSHKIPLKLYMKLLKKMNNISYLIGVQPETLDDSLEEPQLSLPIKTAIERIVGNLRRVIITNNLK